MSKPTLPLFTKSLQREPRYKYTNKREQIKILTFDLHKIFDFYENQVYIGLRRTTSKVCLFLQ